MCMLTYTTLLDIYPIKWSIVCSILSLLHMSRKANCNFSLFWHRFGTILELVGNCYIYNGLYTMLHWSLHIRLCTFVNTIFGWNVYTTRSEVYVPSITINPCVFALKYIFKETRILRSFNECLKSTYAIIAMTCYTPHLSRAHHPFSWLLACNHYKKLAFFVMLVKNMYVFWNVVWRKSSTYVLLDFVGCCVKRRDINREM